LFPFGHGLSYTTFDYRNLTLINDDLAPEGVVTATVDVTNTGQRSGYEVVQLYVADAQARLMRPPKELKAFAKVWLRPGQTSTVRLQLGMRAFAYFDDAQGAWVADAGRFEVLVGRSSTDIRAHATFTLAADWAQPVSLPS